MTIFGQCHNVLNNKKQYMGFFPKLKLPYLRKMHGYPKFSFWIPRALAKFCFLRIVLSCNWCYFLLEGQ